MHQSILILDFGSQTTQLIGRRLRELNEYCEIVPYNKFPEYTDDIKGVILSGSPYSVYDPTAFKADLTNIRGKFPVLGICYGAQFLAYTSGGNVESAGTREYGRANLSYIDAEDELLKEVQLGSQIWMSHGDSITKIPSNFKKIASSDDVELAAYKIEGEQTWGVQFHPEVFHTVDGTLLLQSAPANELKSMQSTSYSVSGKESLLPSAAVEILAEVSGEDSFSMLLSNELGEEVAITKEMGLVTVDRRKAGKANFNRDFAAAHSAPMSWKAKSLRIFLDASSIEVFVNDGELVLTSLLFPTSPWKKVTVIQGLDEVEILDLQESSNPSLEKKGNN
jgi:GMP synthase (glutamine-hydrolysing) A subunit